MEKKVQRVIIAVLGGMGVILAGRSISLLQKDGYQWGMVLAGNAYSELGEEAAAGYLPLFQYEESDAQTSETFLQRVYEAAKDQIPFYGYWKQQSARAKVIEDENTCHALIEANEQAAERLLGENQQQAIDEENERAKAESAGGEAAPDADAAAGSQESGESEAEQTSAVPNPQIDLSAEALSDYNYVLNNFFVVDPNTYTDESEINAAAFLEKDLTMAAEKDKPQILIYHTHSQEEFADSAEGDVSTSVVAVGDYLTQILEEQYGYQVIHMTDTFDLVNGELDRSKAYNYAQGPVEQMIAENPSIEVVIDLHRDGVPEGTRLVTDINGKPTARIMLFNGLSRTADNGELDYLPNPYIQDNLAFSFQLSYQAKQYYPDFTRCIYLKGYRYNLHVRPRSILLEVGAQTNTFEEAKNAMEPFADILHRVLSGSG